MLNRPCSVFKNPNNTKNSFLFCFVFLNVCCVFVFYVFLCCSVCWFLYGPFYHDALKRDKSTLFTILFLRTSLQVILYFSSGSMNRYCGVDGTWWLPVYDCVRPEITEASREVHWPEYRKTVWTSGYVVGLLTFWQIKPHEHRIILLFYHLKKHIITSFAIRFFSLGKLLYYDVSVQITSTFQS